jgi:hypothetical protein
MTYTKIRGFYSLFKENFEKNWRDVIIGIIAGFCVFLLPLKLLLIYKILAIAGLAILLNLVYSLFESLDMLSEAGSSKKANKKQLIKKEGWSRSDIICLVGAIGSLVLAAVAVWALVSSTQASDKTNNLNERLINMTPSRYAYIDATTIRYLDNHEVFYLKEIEEGTEVNLSLNIINTGQLNTGGIEIGERYDDPVFNFNIVQVRDIESMKNNVSIISFRIKNYTNILGVHPVNITINCPNCLEQGQSIDKQIFICIANDYDFKDVANIITRDCNWIVKTHR